ncbi:MAG: amidohydrolase [Xanthomonadales bacterium]|nr:amidohydrolase [Xanthomonadales bacterium]
MKELLTRLCSLMAVSVVLCGPALAQVSWEQADQAAEHVFPQVVEWRRWFHQNPELSNREFQTAARITEILQGMGLEPQTGIAHTGVVAIIEGGKPGPLVAIRADIDGLPVTEETGLPFASQAKGNYQGTEVGVMHACGHDAHMAMALGAAKVLNDFRDELAGSVMLIFQPAEEGKPVGADGEIERGGAKMMIEEGIFEEHKPEAVFGIHVGIVPQFGTISVRPGPIMAASDRWWLTVTGKQTHGARPWGGVDPIVLTSQIILAYQTIASRQVDVTKAPSIISVGRINGGVRNNVIPEQVEIEGTVRTFDVEMRDYILAAMERTAQGIAATVGATAEFTLADDGNLPLINDYELTERMMPVLNRVTGDVPVARVTPQTVAEDFSEFSMRVPSLYMFLGSLPEGTAPEQWASNHSPNFDINEQDMQLGVRAFTHMVLSYFQDDTD